MSKPFTPYYCENPDCLYIHIDNCPNCFGFGLRRTGSPIPAFDVEDEISNSIPCPVCGSTVNVKLKDGKNEDINSHATF